MKFTMQAPLKPAVTTPPALRCPRCGAAGIRVPAETVHALVLVDLAENENSHAYFLCMAKSCEVAYYGNDGSLVALASDLKVPLWYKDGAEPRYACYCSRVTADQVRSAVREGGARTVAEVNAITGAMKDSDCLHNNPLGKCCHAIIKEVIEEALPNKLSP